MPTGGQSPFSPIVLPMMCNTRLRRFATLFLVLAATHTECSSAELRILTYNIHHGRGADGKVDIERIAGVIRSANPDLVALNEVDKNVSRSGNVNQPVELGRLCEMRPVFEKNIDYDGGEYGNAILSRFPVSETENIHLPSEYEGEQRGMLAVRVELPGNRKVRFAATHLDYRPDDTERIRSAKTIEKLVEQRFAPDRFVIAGDLNATPASQVVERFSRSWTVSRSDPTYPASDPQKQIDYVLWRPASAWRVISTNVLDAPTASDHRPVLVVLDLFESRP